MSSTPTGLLDRIVNSTWNYWASLAGDVAACVVFLALTGMRYDGRPIVVATSLAAGYVSWTALEYLLHRFVLHGPPSAARRGHRRHHRDSEELLSTPALFFPIVALALWAGLGLLLPGDVAAALLLGATSGYLLFGLVHHAHHHARGDSAFLRRLRRHHELHHRQPGVNFGTTTTIWDRLFGTFAPAGEPQGGPVEGRA
jgi:sterol desaturase/sphingolipid hydroxylase (fatty acid hydroxylase superfamily)